MNNAVSRAEAPALVVEHLTKTYASGVEALKDVNLTVAAGDFFALLGPNGAGKSTLIGILSALVNKTGGQVRVFGHDLDRDLESVKRCLGVVPQEFNCNGFETVEHVLFNQAGYYGVPRRTAERNAARYLKALGLWEKRSDVVRNLSGGMKRRLMIARALVHEPRLLILDEPTAGVDIELRRGMWTFLQELNAQGVTIILTTHYLEEAEQLCRNIAIIDHGRIIEHTAMRDLLARLGTETLVLTLAEPVHVLPASGDYPLRLKDAHTLEVDVRADQDLNSLFGWLGARGIRVRFMRNKANRLEELFVQLVGANAQEIADTGVRA
ncbi:MAG TPA: ABC transporter ATP-binding protein [Candidatus Acidoferrales bacterium]|nr:ABC transporter ATP-binding protein [Candidatus Acidoferrales bacterium]